MKTPKAPQTPAVPDPVPPVTQVSRETIQAQQDTAKQAQARKGVNQTLYARETGGSSNVNVPNAFGAKTLLGS